MTLPSVSRPGPSQIESGDQPMLRKYTSAEVSVIEMVLHERNSFGMGLYVAVTCDAAARARARGRDVSERSGAWRPGRLAVMGASRLR